MRRLSFALPIVFGLLAGLALAAQPGANGRLGSLLQHPLQASVISFATGLAILLVVATLMGVLPPKINGSWSQVPWWGYTGGAIGVLVVTSSLIFGPKIGGLAWLGLLITGQILGSALLDHFGLVGYPQRRINLFRAAGIACLVGGMVLVFLGTRSVQAPADPVSED